MTEQIKPLYLKLGMFGACMTFLFVSSICNAAIYKWRDADGKMHYSESKEEAGRAQAQAVKIRATAAPAPTETPASAAMMQRLQKDAADYKAQQAQQESEQRDRSREAAKADPAPGKNQAETDESRCALARNVLSGAVHHRNGAPTDKNDREIAENDVRAFCH
jgi:Domain of unknown function (DUF4124)